MIAEVFAQRAVYGPPGQSRAGGHFCGAPKTKARCTKSSKLGRCHTMTSRSAQITSSISISSPSSSQRQGCICGSSRRNPSLSSIEQRLQAKTEPTECPAHDCGVSVSGMWTCSVCFLPDVPMKVFEPSMGMHAKSDRYSTIELERRDVVLQDSIRGKNQDRRVSGSVSPMQLADGHGTCEGE